MVQWVGTTAKRKCMLENFREVLSELRRKLSLYITSSGLKSLVIGVSGGVDSALAVAIAKPVCDSLKIPLIGAWIGMGEDVRDEHRRALSVGEEFCTTFVDESFSIEYFGLLMTQEHPEVKFSSLEISNYLPIETEDDLKRRADNIKARLRMIYLYNLAKRFDGATIDTSTKTDRELGLWTIHGDDFDIALLSRFWKTEVYGLAKYVVETEVGSLSVLASCVRADSSSKFNDVGQFGCENYEEVDGILLPIVEAKKNKRKVKKIVEGLCVKYDCNKVRKVYEQHKKTSFKREVPICL